MKLENRPVLLLTRFLLGDIAAATGPGQWLYMRCLPSSASFPPLRGRSKGRAEKEDAVLLDMGWYVRCTKGQTIPSLLTPQYLHSVRAPAAPAAAASATAALMGLKLGALSGSREGSMADGLPGGEAAAGGGGGAAATSQSAAGAAAQRGSSGGGGGADPPTAEGSFKTNGRVSASASARSMAPDLTSIYLEDREGEVSGSRRMRPESQVQQLQRERAAFDADLQGQQVVRLYQVLAPSLVGRGRVFGSRLALKDEWQALDVPYFDAPGEDMG